MPTPNLGLELTLGVACSSHGAIQAPQNFPYTLIHSNKKDLFSAEVVLVLANPTSQGL